MIKTSIQLAVWLLAGSNFALQAQPHTGPEKPAATGISYWLTKSDASVKFAKQPANLVFKKGTSALPTITVDAAQTFQEIDGFGYALTGGSATLIHSLGPEKEDALLKELFLTDGNNIGVSYLRVTIGASDLSDTTFTYDDMPAGQTDEKLEHFSITREEKDLLPVLKKILALNPAIKILGSPWTSPTWMKTNNSFKGGSLKPEYYGVYAQYFVKYIQAMQAAGVTIDAITPQNEPLHGGNVPSLVMQPQEQADFIGSHLGPALRAAGLKTKIIVYDHNADRPDYPITVLNDKKANPFVDGSAFHLYGGPITALTEVHNAHPDKHIYFTEQWVGAPGEFPKNLPWHISQLIIGATRNWSRNVLEWNLAADANYDPHTVGGCTKCLGAVTIGADVERNVAYYIIAHASKFVRPGSVRIGSNVPEKLNNVAFKTPDGKKVLIVINEGTTTQQFNIGFKGKTAAASLDGGTVATYVWE
ncbi:glucosylceramidase [Chitinophaga agrisoli]|uniref:Glucosylceramidase n=1 Tax=Chitinophaga agrisoli TaxID=2607653 RepID=A0A5B2VNT8_9BACT|nr:glycoside hydrolase family 30 beta sandwich domain-containing protein [Chitinophaga agrisoli]KAA2240378.1 glucosylceramidase [Chitinophaga agrisoli]